MTSSTLDQIIPPEVKDDELYTLLVRVAQEPTVQTVLEIGSSSGMGSTAALVEGLQKNPNNPRLYCMEISQARFANLQSYYAHLDFIHCYNISSVALNKFPTEQEIKDFYYNHQTILNRYPLATVLSWYHQDITYLRTHNADIDGINFIKNTQGIQYYDLVVIDGSEFTGRAELDLVYGAKFIFLDDTNSYKNFDNFEILSRDPNYTLVHENKSLRNGYAFFRRVPYGFETEYIEQKLVNNRIKLGMTVFDIGANVGDYTILLSELVGGYGRVFAFEPTDKTFEKLEERVADYENLRLVKAAVTNYEGYASFNEFSEELSAWNSLGTPVMEDPSGSGEIVPILKSTSVLAITLNEFCIRENIETIDYLKVDVEGAEYEVLQGADQLLKTGRIKFIQFEISQKMLEGLQRKAKDVFDLLQIYGYECHQITPQGEIGELATDSDAFYKNYVAFPVLPIHFLTIVLNGEPFIRYHIDVLKQLPCKWHWHIVEGVAELKYDTAWSLQSGGHITTDMHQQGLSKDGTTTYLDALEKEYPERITIYRKPKGLFWDGKLEMVNAPLINIQEPCLLWQIDVDEFWNIAQLLAGRLLFLNHPEKSAAYFWCHYFVGQELIIGTRYGYAQNPNLEWLRVWKFEPTMQWVAHEPPILMDNQGRDVGRINTLFHAQTEQAGLVFQHFAYVTPAQLLFKEQYYGYRSALAQWQKLQNQEYFPVQLRNYFAWVSDDTQVIPAKTAGITSLCLNDGTFRYPTVLEYPSSISTHRFVIVIDAVFFQLYNTGIARVWRSLMEVWATQEFSQHLVILDRERTAPQVAGLRYRTISFYRYEQVEIDRAMLQEICDKENAALFISTYYTTPASTPSVFMAYDMIPEVVGADLTIPMWREKHRAIKQAQAALAISTHTAQDLQYFFPEFASDRITVAHCGVSSLFYPAANTLEFCQRYGIDRPYFLLVGARGDYKNTELFFKALSTLPSRHGLAVVCLGGGLLEPMYRSYTSGITIYNLHLDDAEMALAYSGALALVYPSKYEGFGLPVLEALACGCPVITCPVASLPEVAGEAGFYVPTNSMEILADALCEIQKPSVRQQLIERGLAQAKNFSWEEMANKVATTLILETLHYLNLQSINWIAYPDWSAPEEELNQLLSQLLDSTLMAESALTLLLVVQGKDTERANELMTEVGWSWTLEHELEPHQAPEITLLQELHPLQWKTLGQRIQYRITFVSENQNLIQSSGLEHLPQRPI